MKPIFLLFGTMMFLQCHLLAQTNGITGTFSDAAGTMTVRIKKVGTAYHGVIQTFEGSLAIKGTLTGNQMNGHIYASGQKSPFSAFSGPNALLFSAFGYSVSMYKVSAQHELDGVDLTQFMNEGNQGIPQQNQNPQPDFDYSYSQHNRGHASENLNVYNQAPQTANSPYPALNDPQLQQVVAGSQLVYYTRTSYLNDATASSITYVNFCRNGKFSINYDGSFSVEGYYGDNAQGASYGKNAGTWQLVTYNGQPAVFLAYNNGQTSINTFNKANVYAGRWRIGNTQYALVRNKVNCR